MYACTAMQRHACHAANRQYKYAYFGGGVDGTGGALGFTLAEGRPIAPGTCTPFTAILPR